MIATTRTVDRCEGRCRPSPRLKALPVRRVRNPITHSPRGVLYTRRFLSARTLRRASRSHHSPHVQTRTTQSHPSRHDCLFVQIPQRTMCKLRLPRAPTQLQVSGSLRSRRGRGLITHSLPSRRRCPSAPTLQRLSRNLRSRRAQDRHTRSRLCSPCSLGGPNRSPASPSRRSLRAQARSIRIRSRLRIRAATMAARTGRARTTSTTTTGIRGTRWRRRCLGFRRGRCTPSHRHRRSCSRYLRNSRGAV